ncbi:hypothetical protein GCM10018952_51630 [Streptosporangium vulgare]
MKRAPGWRGAAQTTERPPATTARGVGGRCVDTGQLIRRGAHKSVEALEKDIRAWISQWNDNSRPFVWKTAEKIVESLARYRRRISGAGP